MGTEMTSLYIFDVYNNTIHVQHVLQFVKAPRVCFCLAGFAALLRLRRADKDGKALLSPTLRLGVDSGKAEGKGVRHR